jgi:hypothetical protein
MTAYHASHRWKHGFFLCRVEPFFLKSLLRASRARLASGFSDGDIDAVIDPSAEVSGISLSCPRPKKKKSE